MTHNYVVTAQKSTAVFNAISGNFTSPTDLNLILDKLCRIEVHLVTAEGLRSLKEIPLNGRISVIKSFRMPNEDKDLLFIMTLKNNLMILELSRDPKHGDFEVNTRAHGIITEKSDRPSENGTLCDVNAKARIIALRIYDGILNVLKLDFKNRNIKSYNIRVEENTLIDFVFLHGYDKPVLCFIYQEDRSRHLKTYEITEDRELRRGPWLQENIESDSSMLIPVSEPYGGVIVVGQESITHIIDQNQYTAIAPPEIASSNFSCFCKIDTNRFLLGDLSGQLFILILHPNVQVASSSSAPVSPYGLKLISLGETSVSSCLSYLDNNYVFVGSRFGDSQLIKLKHDDNDTRKYIEIMDTYVSLAPIVDILVVDLDKQGQDQLITCSGAYKEGSLRIIRNGIGINELATIDLPGIKGVWQLKVDSIYDNVVAMAFVGQTKLLKLKNEEVEETFITGFDCSQETMYTGNIIADQFEMIVQITANCIRLLSVHDNRITSKWIPPSNITLVSVNDCQIICSSRNKLLYLEVIRSEIKLINEIEMEYEASCLDISSLTEKRSKLCAVGLWKDISVRIMSLPDFKLLHTEKLGGEIIARSTLMAHFDHTSYLFTAIGDGSLLSYILNTETGTLSEKKKVVLGTHPTFLKMFKTNSSSNIFACSDRPAVIYSSNNKLIFSNVNLKEVNHMCTLNSEGYPDSLILTNDSQLLIGQIDQIQKLHIRTIALNETPRRIAYQESTQTFGVITMRYDVQLEDGQMVSSRISASTLAQNITHSRSLPTMVKPTQISNHFYPNELEVYHLLIIDQTTFEVLHAHQFMVNEYATSLVSCKLGNDANHYYIVGTTFMISDDIEPKAGRIIVFQLVDGKLQQVAEKEIKGVPFWLHEFHGKLLAAINTSIRLFEWTSTHELHMESSVFSSTLAIHTKTKGDFVLLGDLLRSFSLFAYSPLGGTFTQLAHDLESAWLSAMEIIDDDTFIGADTNFNLYLAQKDLNVADDPDRSKFLTQCGFFHLGDLVNVMKHGYLVMNYPHEMNNPIINKPILFGTYSGSIGLIAQIPKDYYEFLLKLQKNLASKIKSVGKIDYDFWRTYTNDKKTEPSLNFIDGDLIESFLDLNSTEMAECAEGIMYNMNGQNRTATVDDIIKIVEELSRIH